MERLFGYGKKNIYIGLSAVAVWITTLMYYISMDNLLHSDDGVRMIAGALGQWLVGYMIVFSVVQLVILLGGIFVKENRYLLIGCMILEILFFLAMQLFVLCIYATAAVMGIAVSLLVIVVLEISNIFGIISMVKEVRRK